MTSSQDETKVRLVLAHEYYRCNQAFLDFAEISVVNIGGKTDKRLRFKMFDAYSRFLHHLYEFYLGISKLYHNQERVSDGIDVLVQDEIERIMRIRADRIREVRAPSHENPLSYYEQPVPLEFAVHLRRIRNWVAHADARRAGGENVLTLPEFYKKYRRYVFLLYEEAEWLWKVDPVSFDWGEIEAFGLAVQSAAGQAPAIARLVVRVRDWLFERQLLKAIRSRR